MNQTQKKLLEAYKILASIDTINTEELAIDTLNDLETVRSDLFELLDEEGIDVEKHM